ncbi:MAG: HlyD family secretion protein [Spirochaetia bacterium]|jgi:RND family efflux transporter MFP subunit
MSTNNEQNTAGAKGPAKKKIRKGPRVVGLIILVVVVIAGACYGGLWWIDSAAYVSTDDAAIDGRQVKLSPKMLGRIGTVLVTEGEKVKAGQLVALLEDKDLRAQEAQAAASLTYAKENLALAKVTLDKSQEDFDRTNKLYAAAAATRESFEHAKSALQTAKAQYTLAEASVDTSTAQLGVIEAQVLNVKITTPIDGTVEKVTLNAGDLVQPGQTILSVNNLDAIWVIANFEETKIGRIRVGAPVKINVDAYNGRPLVGTVDMIRAGIVPSAFQIGDFTKTTQRVPVKITFSSPLDALTMLPGMSVEVKVRTPAKLPEFALRLKFF